MKTKPIQNTVKQWEDRAVLGVKSLIKWLLPGGKKNRERKERTGNKHRKKIKNKQYK